MNLCLESVSRKIVLTHMSISKRTMVTKLSEQENQKTPNDNFPRISHSLQLNFFIIVFSLLNRSWKQFFLTVRSNLVFIYQNHCFICYKQLYHGRIFFKLCHCWLRPSDFYQLTPSGS